MTINITAIDPAAPITVPYTPPTPYERLMRTMTHHNRVCAQHPSLQSEVIGVCLTDLREILEQHEVYRSAWKLVENYSDSPTDMRLAKEALMPPILNAE